VRRDEGECNPFFYVVFDQQKKYKSIFDKGRWRI
jgi:hypothetical protein